ncbi:MAG TPA: GPW/gp25 family protein [Trebonia sp.]|nr:GPW/gp25 family protein [Trebonia sp.]
MTPARRDYNVPFGIDHASRQVSGVGYAAHVEQMIMQVLFTTPGERVNLPQFGCGLRQLVFGPLSSALAVNTEITVRQALGRWLGGLIEVGDVTAQTSGQPGGPLEPGTLQVTISYTLLDTRTTHQTQVILP